MRSNVEKSRGHRRKAYPDLQQDGAGPHGMESTVQLFCVLVSDFKTDDCNFPGTLTDAANILTPDSILAT